MNDYIAVATAANHRIRAYAATTRLTVEQARRRHDTSPVVTAALGRTLTAAAMLGALLKAEDETVTLRISGDGPVGMLIAVADPQGNVKGYAGNNAVDLPPSAKGKLDVGKAVGAGTLSVTRAGANGEPFTGTTELVSGEIAEDLTYYFAASEQTPSSVGLGVLMSRDNTVRRAGGFIVQLMPGIEEETIEKLEKRLGSIDSVTAMLEKGMTPEDILSYIFEGMGLELMETRPVRFHCGCSRRKTLRVIAGLDPKALNEWVGKGLETEVVCEYCAERYTYSADEVRIAMEEHRKRLEEDAEKK
ncbi:MAG: Hsp33 family molecular chaperone HslO [Oscillospiraceae bacterium]|nr:Hsp33 family molecular chaperone HslO [Oscillospiraceae bacterium]